MATGSEVELCVAAAKQSADRGIAVQVVSMPCCEVFDSQDTAYQAQVLPAAVTARVAVEAGATLGWHKYVGSQGQIIGIDRFGESAPAPDIYKALGITVEHIVQSVEAQLA